MADEILVHPWFTSLDIPKLLAKQLEPTFIPKLSTDKFDVSNFDSQVTNLSAKESVISEGTRESIKNIVSPFKNEFEKLN